MGENNKVIPQKKGNSKNKKKGILAIVLVLALVIGGTLAYLGTRSNTEENIFTGSKDISLTLTEPKWNDTKSNEDKPEKDRAKEYTPGGTYLKNPKLYNSSDDEAATEWVAMKISFQLEDLTKSVTGTKGESLLALKENGTIELTDATWKQMNELIKIQIANTGDDNATIPFKDGFNSDWTLICTSADLSGGKLPASFNYGTTKNGIIEDDATWAIFVYKKTISNNTDKNNITSTNKDTFDTWAANNNGVTTSLFDRIQILPQATLIGNGYKKANPNQTGEENYPEVNVYLPKFEIKVEGAAIKNEIKGSDKNLISDLTDTNLTAVDANSIKKELIGLFDVDTSNLG
ncbi:MAG: hypothetical protein K2N51_10810 [Lachnospiraceae bacterium]|nr:hypothetical protein [Lachnospiraceae bacterium]